VRKQVNRKGAKSTKKGRKLNHEDRKREKRGRGDFFSLLSAPLRFNRFANLWRMHA